ncbi:MAG TPA: hypothetical protein QF555_03760 [Candidatus Thalassarchaeaceae archaeon]|nr:hypothetical protein [Candidatus Thalassarchaeaceae archaeon]
MGLGPRGWVAVGAWVSLILVPIFHYYWRRWDRPSKAAQEEMDRRKQELEVRRAFEIEDMKLRAEEAKQAKMELEQRKRVVPVSIDSEVLDDAFGQLGMESNSEPIIQEPLDVDIPRIQEMLESLPDVEEEFVTPDSGPIHVELPKTTQIDEEPESSENEVEPAPNLESWDETDW